MSCLGLHAEGKHAGGGRGIFEDVLDSVAANEFFFLRPT